MYGWFPVREQLLSWPELVGLGLTPPRLLAYTVVPWSHDIWYDWSTYHEYENPARFGPLAACGLAVYGLVAWGLAALASRRFQQSLAVRARRRPVPAFPVPEPAL